MPAREPDEGKRRPAHADEATGATTFSPVTPASPSSWTPSHKMLVCTSP